MCASLLYVVCCLLLFVVESCCVWLVVRRALRAGRFNVGYLSLLVFVWPDDLCS